MSFHKVINVVVCVGGGIAAYKAPMVVRGLLQKGYAVRVVMTEAATRFVGAATFSGLTGKQPLLSMWDADGEPHIELSAWAHAVVVVPATADLLSKMAHGVANDAVSATLIATAVPVLVAPGMHTRMWQHRAVAENVATLKARGVVFCGPVSGPLASGDVGEGRMSEPQEIADAVDELFITHKHDLAGLHILVSAGPTLEAIDPVRFIGNRSSGKMGYAIAQAAIDRGACVTLVSGPVAIAPPIGVQLVSVRSALEMQSALQQTLERDVNILLMAAAVADYRPTQAAPHKLKKDAGALQSIALIENPDILAGIGAWRQTRNLAQPVLVGFALETQNLVAAARKKLRDKQIDLVVANLAEDAFEGDCNRAVLVSENDEQALDLRSKSQLAHDVLDRAIAIRSQSL